MKLFIPVLIAAGLCYISSALADDNEAANPPVQPQQQVQQPGTAAGTVTDTETVTESKAPKLTKKAEEMSADAVAVVNHVNEARDHLLKKTIASLKMNSLKAESLVDVIRSRLPTITVKDSIANAQKHLTVEAAEKVQPDLIPIYASLTVADDYVPTKEARAHVDKAKAYMKNGDKKSAMNELKLADASITYTEVDLPLNETQKNIRAALASIDKKQIAQARVYLQRNR